jgi:putative component of membrane protein insertase Oxa1/YidC/SpoIIIJ protein YidD
MTKLLNGSHMGGKWQLACRGCLEAKVVQLRNAPHTLLAILMISLFSCRACKTCRRWPTCSSWFLLQITMLSTQAKAAWQSLMALSTCYWKDGSVSILFYSNRTKRGW